MKTMKELLEATMATAKISVISKNIEKKINVFKNYENKATDKDKNHIKVLHRVKMRIDSIQDLGDDINWPSLKTIVLRSKDFKKTGLKVNDFEYLMNY